MKSYSIQPLNENVRRELQQKIDYKTKPIGALGKLEELALQVGLIQGTETPELRHPHVLVFAADHGIANSGVSAYPQEVTWQMVQNFLNGGAAINVFCNQHQIQLYVIDAGVNYTFNNYHSRFINAKIGYGTQNFLEQPAMTLAQVYQCLQKGNEVIELISKQGCNIVGFGEMGIGNTSSASLITSLICERPIAECTGKGTGIDEAGLIRKIAILEKALNQLGKLSNSLDILATFGGFEIAQMAGAMLAAAEKKMILLIDGFISTAAFLIAHSINPLVKEYAVFCHQSEEMGHQIQLDYLQVEPLLHLHLRLGEGTGTALAYPLVQSAVGFFTEMASFESAGVSK
ncbi:nicotinate-nucleotide--dimethylbenzimidazole phosphoribosyltransferase [Rhodocytophaga rosea]|uniref:Nicotinate-nucleotide--dimethylbenzimidazole phosphoribosyltransferase n=1 Tax=Rhodocytophaga rosea TaxID=2704465 RepID=A0A6C0GSI8_9BACT|nr:nicotinate-nucleotide--dimethylbenzimidazole phosphoribosyltransferase [Rhodocytophaga rosea]QHT71069.1 nicotinate-nucleotide--dimethylbenzimidazole phosphoribosyltransferase [Rhodocytophaga rosea]